MTFRQLQNISFSHYYALTIDKFFPKILRNVLRKLSALAVILSFVFSFASLPLYFGFADGLFFLFIIIYLILFFVEVFYRSMKGEGVQVKIFESIVSDKKLDYFLSGILFATDEIDATRAIFETKIGMEILMRAGLSKESCHNFIYSGRIPVITSSLIFEGDAVNLGEYVGVVYDTDKSLQSFLAREGVRKEEFVGSATWVMQMNDKKFRQERFWSRENLGAMPSIGKSWSYGVATDLGLYGVSFLSSTNISLLDIENGYRSREVSLLESILERKEEANGIIIDDDPDVARDIVARLLKKIKLGVSTPSIEHKDIIELKWNDLIVSFKNKVEFEAEFLKVLNQSIGAGNVILYISDLSSFVSELKNMGINLGSLMAPYLNSPSLQILASATNADFHFFIETNPVLLQRFERIIPDKIGVEASLPALFEQSLFIEKQYGILFSYPAILNLANSAERFVTYGEMPGKALNMLSEIAPWAVEQSISVLRENDIAVFVAAKTGIAGGPIGAKEAELISHLEEFLHKRVVGQEEAVSSIANAIRRSRSLISNPKRPIASFLFLGPTGVGKTEVAKALAESFFGDENKMIRFDMSEYNSADALAELIGDFATSKSGFLANKVRDNPYSVLLLDELEKASRDVLDLFLQVLDEGMFTDALGKQVGCRNLIIIATSNAGSSYIWDAVKSGKDLVKEKDNIIDSIIADKFFRPEFLNRFDGVVLFHPLGNEELKSVAKLGLQKLKNRLKEQNIELVINDQLVNFLVTKGSDPENGGRAINRTIQNTIEDLIARKIVSGEIVAGGSIEIKETDLVG